LKDAHHVLEDYSVNVNLAVNRKSRRLHFWEVLVTLFITLSFQ
jgi:hypothetical protein